MTFLKNYWQNHDEVISNISKYSVEPIISQIRVKQNQRFFRNRNNAPLMFHKLLLPLSSTVINFLQLHWGFSKFFNRHQLFTTSLGVQQNFRQYDIRNSSGLTRSRMISSNKNCRIINFKINLNYFIKTIITDRHSTIG